MSELYIEIDPTKSFKHVDAVELQYLCGIIPNWIAEWEYSITQEAIGCTLLEYLGKRYDFGLNEFKGSSIADDGCYISTYKEDPKMFPVMKAVTRDGDFYLYQYGIVAIPRPGQGHYVTRMD